MTLTILDPRTGQAVSFTDRLAVRQPVPATLIRDPRFDDRRR